VNTTLLIARSSENPAECGIRDAAAKFAHVDAARNAQIDGRKTEVFREAARARARAQWTPAARVAQSELTRQKMKAPGVRERIVAGTTQAKKRALELGALRTAWRCAEENVRLQFLAEITSAQRPPTG